MKRLKLKQDMLFILAPVSVDILALIFAALTHGIFRYVFLLMFLVFTGLFLYQVRPIIKLFSIVIGQKNVQTFNILDKMNREIDWKRIQGVAIGYKKVSLIYIYNIYFRVKGKEDLSFALISRNKNLGPDVQRFIKVFVRRGIPVQMVKA